MQATVKPWHRACSHCGKPTFVDLLDEQGFCDYCRETAAMKVSSRKKAGGEVTPQKTAAYRK